MTQINNSPQETPTLVSQAAQGIEAESELASTQPPSRISVVAVADAASLASLRESLAGEQTIVLAGENEGTAGAMRTLRKVRPDVLILDAAFAHMLASVRLYSPRTKVILLADQCSERSLAEALQHGARGCLCPRVPSHDWVQALHAVHRGEMWMARRALASVLDDLLTQLDQNEHASAEWRGALSDRESQVANGVRQGLTNKEIARRLHISDATVKTHLENIFHKLNVTRRVQLAMLTLGSSAQSGAETPNAPREG